MAESQLAHATLRLAGDDLYDEARARGHTVDFGEFEEPERAGAILEDILAGHGDGSVHPGEDGHPGADLAYRLAIVDAAFRPNEAVSERNPSPEVRAELVKLVEPTIRQGLDRTATAEQIVGAFEHGHATLTRSDVPNQIAASVVPEALLFLTLECSTTGETVSVDGMEVRALALFDYQETTMGLDSLQGISDPFNWPDCNSAFKSITPIPGSFWQTPHAYGIDIVEVFSVPFLEFETTTALSITYVDLPQQKQMSYDLSTANADHGDGQVAVDRGFARAVDLGDRRRAEALKVVHFRDDTVANATSWFSCIWWDLLSVRTAVLCPNRTVTPASALSQYAPTGPQVPSGQGRGGPAPVNDAAPGPLETLAREWSDIVLEWTRESMGVATRTAKRWPPGEQVTGGKLTSDLIEGFERLTPKMGKGIDLWLHTVQQGLDRVAPGNTREGGDR